MVWPTARRNCCMSRAPSAYSLQTCCSLLLLSTWIVATSHYNGPETVCRCQSFTVLAIIFNINLISFAIIFNSIFFSSHNLLLHWVMKQQTETTFEEKTNKFNCWWHFVRWHFVRTQAASGVIQLLSSVQTVEWTDWVLL